MQTCRAGTNLCCPTCKSPPEVKQSSPLPPCFSSQPVNKCPLCTLFSAMSCKILCFWLTICCIKLPPILLLKSCLAFLSTQENFDVSLEKIQVLLDELSSGMSSNAVGYELNENESTIQIT